MPRAALVYGYYLGYDWTMMLADLPDRDLYRLLRPELRALQGEGGNFSDVAWRDFRLHYLGGMMRVRNLATRRQVTVWDVGKFYQESFCRLECTDDKHGPGQHDRKCFAGALPKWSIGTLADWERIASMKAQRSTFTTKQREQVRAYCMSECALLAQAVEALNDAHLKAGLPLRKWYGPGSSASVALGQLGIKKKRGEHPPEVNDAASRAFFGGRFENRTIGTITGRTFRKGVRGSKRLTHDGAGIWGYDLVSAYPAATRGLPCLEHGRWRRTIRERDISAQARGLVRFWLAPTDREAWWGPLPIRLAQGSIVFPRSGASGWCYVEEFLAARAHWPNVEFLEGWLLESSDRKSVV